jgi:Fibronectin type III domain
MRAGVIAALLLVLAGVAVGVVIALGASGKGVKAASTPKPAPSPSLVPPTGLSANADSFSVTLTWTQPSGGSPIQTYDIYRNDTLVDEVDAGTTTYTDQSVSPGRRYRYELRAAANELQTSFVSVSVKTPKPPLTQARLAGDFNVRFKFASQSGFSKTTGFTAGWSFKPKCSDGPCDVKWSDLGEKTLRATLDRKGAKYSGQDDGLFFATCGSHRVTSHLVITFTVTKAKGMDGEWRATAIKGTVDHSAASQLGCVSSSATLSITGNLLS